VVVRILVVDDDPDMLETYAQILTQHGYVCLTASAGSQAIAMMDAEGPDLVVTDLHMPGVDGLTVVRHARTRVPPIPVVLITAWPHPRDAGARCLGEATAHLAKPFANTDLLETVRRVLGKTEPRHPHGLRSRGQS
jgi:CheY-like chemotaxis protein